MAKLLERLNADLRDAMRARDALRTSVLRMLLTRIKEKQVEKGVDSPLDDKQIELVMASFAKQRRDSAEAFDKAGRTDLRDKEIREREIVMAYLPEQLDDAAVRAVLQEIVGETGASTPGDLGRVMGAAMKRLRGRVDGGRVQALAREILGR
ncbi:MAG: GatB/YqeY domain-containing protein [Candidatus Latescibacterota bacterium]|nr:MAG: GatB/YqeY domain-containing protein [Candidatus Latescibacterota bacterium]